MSESIALESSERQSIVEAASFEVRQKVDTDFTAAGMYQEVILGDGERVRNAAHWLVQHLGMRAKNLKLADEDYLSASSDASLDSANQKIYEAERLEYWAGCLFDSKDKRDVIALNETSSRLDIELPDKGDSPQALVKFEASIPADNAKIGALIENRRKAEMVMKTGEGLATLDITQAVQQITVSKYKPVTPEKLVTIQIEILSGKIEEAQSQVDLKRGVLNTYISGVLMGELREKVYALNPSVFNVISPEISENALSPEHDINIGELELRVRSYNCLTRAGIETIDDLMRRTRDDLQTIPNLGVKCIDEIQISLAERGLSLATKKYK